MKSIFLSVALFVCIAGCSTTNSLMHLTPDYTDLPAEKLSVLAVEIETNVSAGNTEFSLDDSEGLIVDTPEMRQAIRTRAIRQPLVSALLDSGFAAEEKNGLIAIKRTSAYKKATTSSQRDREALVVMSENTNRWTIYEGLLESNDWAPRNLSAVQETFFQSRIPLLKDGQLHAPAE